MARPTDWPRLSDDGVFATCVRESAKEIYGYVGLLAGHDRGGAEDIVRELYTALGREVAAGRLDHVDLRRLRTAARRLWLARERSAVMSQASGPPTVRPATTLADLSDAERTVVVFRSVNRMPVEAVAEALRLSPQQVASIEQRAVRRLGGDVSGGLKPWFGPAARPRPGFVDDLVAHAAALTGGPPPERPATREPLPATEPVPVIVPATDDRPADAPAPERAGADVTERVVEPVVDVSAVDVRAVGATDDRPADASGGLTIREPTPMGTIGVGDDVRAPEPEPAADDGPAPRRPGRGRLALIAAVVAAVVVGGVVAVTQLGGDDEPGDAAAPSTSATPDSTVPVTTAPPLDELLPACVERPVSTAPAGPVAPADAAVTEFGPVGTEAALTIQVPLWNGSEGITDPTVVSFRIRGGLIVMVRSPGDVAAERSLVSRIEFDGTVRWVRCFDESVSVAPRVVDDQRGAAIRLGEEWFALGADDGVVGDPVDAPQGVSATAFVEPDEWPDDSFPALAWDGFTAGVSGDVTVVLGCAEPDTAAPLGCARAALRGYGAEQQVLWERAGVLDVAAVQGTYAIIRYAPDGGAGAWYMIDIRDGSAVEGQVWPAETFPSPGLSRGEWTRVDGGFLFTRQGQEVRLFVSRDAQVTPATATIP